MSLTALALAHYFQFYYTWMTPADYVKLWTVLQKTPDLMRPWPSDIVAAAIQTSIGNPPRGGDVTVARMCHFKAVAAIGQRPNYPDQKTIMSASATDVGRSSLSKDFNADVVLSLQRLCELL